MEASPPPEYCLLAIQWWPLCMTRTDWASWVQAVGSIAAVLLAMFVFHRQAKQAIDLEDARLRVQKIGRLQVVLAMLNNAETILAMLEADLEHTGPGCATDSDFGFLRDSGEGLKALPVLEIGDGQLVAVVLLLPRSFAMLLDSWLIAREDEHIKLAYSAARMYGTEPDKSAPAHQTLIARLGGSRRDVHTAIQHCRNALAKAGWYDRGDEVARHL